MPNFTTKHLFSAVILAIFGMGILITIVLNNDQINARYYGGETTINLEEGYKLEDIDWKDSDVWYTIRPMRDNETAETHIYNELRSRGDRNGKMIVIEHEKEDT